MANDPVQPGPPVPPPDPTPPDTTPADPGATDPTRVDPGATDPTRVDPGPAGPYPPAPYQPPDSAAPYPPGTSPNPAGPYPPGAYPPPNPTTSYPSGGSSWPNPATPYPSGASPNPYAPGAYPSPNPSMPYQPGAFPQGAYAPPMAWSQPAQPKRNRTGLIVAISVFAVLLVGCACSALYGLAKLGEASENAASNAGGAHAPRTVRPSESPGTDDSDSTDDGPEASPYGVAQIDDLAQVCKNRYFPQAPKYEGKAPHPVAIMSKVRLDMSVRSAQPMYDIGYSSSTARRKAWEPHDSPKTVQLVACVDLVSGGKKLRTCRYDDPEPESLPLKVGNYRITLYETATHRQLFSKQISGDDHDCPSSVIFGKDHTIYTEISQRYYVELLKPYVEK